MSDEAFSLEIGGAARADVFLACADGDRAIWPVVRRFDEAGVCVAGEIHEAGVESARGASIAAACGAVVAIMPAAGAAAVTVARVRAHLDRAVAAGQPSAVIQPDDDADAIARAVDRLAAGVVSRQSIRPYAFFIGRLERDFRHARAAIRAAVEREAGIACLWSDSDHQTNVAGVRESTRLLIKNAAFIIADLTLGVENPDGENPSRAHEIGMSIAYDRPLMLSSQEPRRYPYFSIADMQMTFWETEAQLYDAVCNWVRARRRTIARLVFNHALADLFPGYTPRLPAPAFVYDSRQRYIGPRTPVTDGSR